MKLKDSKTFLNLARAFASECMARTRYEFVEYGFRYNGYEAIATIIDKIAYQEFNHARMLYTHIQKAELDRVENIDICAGFPFKEKWDMEENLKLIAEDENIEGKVYEEFSAVAYEEGFKAIGDLFENIRSVELKHRDIFKEIYKQFSAHKLYQKNSSDTKWICPSCGYEEEGKEAWETCPLCEAKRGVCEIVLPNNLKI